MNDPPLNDLDLIYQAVLENRKLLKELEVQLEFFDPEQYSYDPRVLTRRGEPGSTERKKNA